MEKKTIKTNKNMADGEEEPVFEVDQ